MATSFVPTSDLERKYRDLSPGLALYPGGSFGDHESLLRDRDYAPSITHGGLPRYWWRQLAVDTDKVVWMEDEKVIHMTTRKAWERIMKFRRDFLAERKHTDWHQRLGYDVLLGPFERPQRRYFDERPPNIILAPVVDAKAWEKHSTKIPKPVSGTTRQYEHWRIRSDRSLWNHLRNNRRINRKGKMLVLQVTALEFLKFSLKRDDPLFEEFDYRCSLSLFENETKAAQAKPLFRQLLKTTQRALPPLRRRTIRRMRFDSPSTMSSPELPPLSDFGRSPSLPQKIVDVNLDDFWLD
ncbi:hypothetical protein KCU95_g12906, partial [Aureobasidium melanogenum]